MGTFFDDASLVMIPSGVKDGKVYSIKPTDGTGDFTFTRGTDTATRVNSSGLIEKERENQLLQSNTFDTTWIASNATITSGHSGYDGSSDAWLLSKTGTAYGSVYQTGIIATNGGVYSFSIYAKANTTNFASFRLSTGSGADNRIKFNLTNGAISLASANNGTRIDAIATDVGNGWYRCSITAQANSTTITLNLYAGDTAATSGSVYVQDAQLEQGLVATDYIETTTAPVYVGITDNLPRLDYSGGASCPSLLLEPQRTNLIEYSEWFGSATWTKQTNITITDNTTDVLSPEGKYNAAKIVSGDATKGFFDNTKSSTANSVRSIYLRGAVGGETLLLKDISGFGGIESITLSTDWVRYELATTNTGDTYRGLFVDNISVGTIYAYGAQWEEGSYPTSYIPTMGVSATRAAEGNVNVQNLNTNGVTTASSAYSLFFDLSAEPVLDVADGNSVILNSYNAENLSSSYITLTKYYQDADGKIRFISNIDGSTIGYVTSTNKKFAMVVNGTTIKVFSNGVLELTYTSINNHNGIGSLKISNGSSNRTSSNFSQVLLFDSVLNDAECITLTTL